MVWLSDSLTLSVRPSECIDAIAMLKGRVIQLWLSLYTLTLSGLSPVTAASHRGLITVGCVPVQCMTAVREYPASNGGVIIANGANILPCLGVRRRYSMAPLFGHGWVTY